MRFFYIFLKSFSIVKKGIFILVKRFYCEKTNFTFENIFLCVIKIISLFKEVLFVHKNLYCIIKKFLFIAKRILILVKLSLFLSLQKKVLLFLNFAV